MIIRLSLMLIAILLAAHSVAAPVAEVYVTNSHPEAGELISYRVETTQIADPKKSVFPDFSKIDGLELDGASSVASTVTTINGKTIIGYRWTYPVLAAKEGKWTIPPAKLLIEGEEITTNQITVDVQPSLLKQSDYLKKWLANADRAIRESSGQPSDFFAVASAPDSVFLGQAFPIDIYTVRLSDYQGAVRQRGAVTLDSESFLQPSMNEAVLVGDVHKSFELAGKQYVRQLHTRIIAVAMEPGAHILPLTPAGLLVENGGAMSETKLLLNPIEIEVKELPKPRLTGDVNLVGNGSIEVSAPSSVIAGEEFEVIVRIDTNGYLNQEDLPAELFSDFEIIGMSGSYDKLTSRDGIFHRKIFAYDLLAKSAGEGAIPPVALSIFDPLTKTYRQIQSDPIAIEVQLAKE